MIEEFSMKVVLIGATGTIGKAVAQALADRHEVVAVSNSKGDRRVDVASAASIERLFAAVGSFDALICAAGPARFKALAELTDEDFQFCLANKLMGQVNLVRIGLRFINPRGSFTLTTGMLAREPMPGSAAISLVNSGVEGFTRAAALEAKDGVRVNAVSPPWVTETLVAYGMDSSGGTPAAQVAKAYAEALDGAMTGQIIDARAVKA